MFDECVNIYTAPLAQLSLYPLSLPVTYACAGDPTIRVASHDARREGEEKASTAGRRIPFRVRFCFAAPSCRFYAASRTPSLISGACR